MILTYVHNYRNNDHIIVDNCINICYLLLYLANLSVFKLRSLWEVSELKTLLPLLAIFLVGSFLLVSCSTSTTQTTPVATVSAKPSTPAAPSPSIAPSTSPSVTPQSGGILNVFLTGTSISSIGYPASMAGAIDGRISSPCVESLFRFDEKSSVIPLLATGWKADVAAKTITVNLRQGVKFHDGTDFNAAAAKWNLDQFRNGNRSELKGVTSIDIVDDYTIRLNLAQYQNTVLTFLAGDAGRMVSPTAFQNAGSTDKDRIGYSEKHPVGTGAFQFASYQPDVGVKYKRFDGYWNGKPYLDGISYLIYADKNSALMDFQKGNLDIFYANATDVPDLIKSGNYNYVVPTYGVTTGLAGYTQDPNSPFTKLEVRQAVSCAIDEKALAQAYGFGYFKTINQWAIPDTWGYNPNVVGYPYDPAKAKQLLAQAGYPNGFNTTINFYNTSQDAINTQTSVQNYLKAVGINAKLNPALRPAYVDMASNGKGWDGLLALIGNTVSDPLVKFKNMAAGMEFKGMYIPQEFTDAYNQALVAPDFASEQKAVWNMTSLSIDKYCMITPMNAQLVPTMKSKRLHDDLIGLIPDDYISPKAWLSK
jgi:peptide/nickel transport system substrate-binding protein